MTTKLAWMGSLLSLCLLHGAAYAACPDFTGSYIHKIDDHSQESLQIQQSICDSMHVVSAMTDYDHPDQNQNFEDDWSLDGVPQNSPQYPPAMRITRQFDDQVLVTEGKLISLQGFVHFISKLQLNADRNLASVTTFYGLTGSVQRETTELYVRQ